MNRRRRRARGGALRCDRGRGFAERHHDDASPDAAGLIEAWLQEFLAGRVAPPPPPPRGKARIDGWVRHLKRELVNRRRYPDRAIDRRSIFEWLARYNTTRRQTSLRCHTPDQYEAHYRHMAGTNPALST